jgi:hypothetical protein
MGGDFGGRGGEMAPNLDPWRIFEAGLLIVNLPQVFPESLSFLSITGRKHPKCLLESLC